MKKICSLVLLLGLIASLFACGETEITMQEIYDANRTEALLQNHQSIYTREKMDGEVCSEKYLTKDYTYEYIFGAESDWVDFMTDDVSYCYLGGDYVCYLPVTPDGVNDGFASYRAKRYASVVLGEDILRETIESVSEKDGRIALTSVLNQENLGDMAEFGVTSCKFEYVLDAKTHEVFSFTNDFVLDDGTAFGSVVEVSYDAEAPEMVKTFLKYANQTEDLRNVTVVSNPGTEKETSKTVQVPKGLIIGLRYDEDSAYVFESYTDAACTESYDPYVNTDSDLTIYVKWAEKAE